MSFPKISVIIPAYNAASTLLKALDSVTAQQMPDVEVIVVDDGSLDGTAEVAERSGRVTRVLRQANAGPAVARNRGIRETEAPWIAFLDADDEWTPGSLRARAEALAAQPELRYVIGRTQFVALDGTKSGKPELQGESWVAPNLGSGLFRREVFSEVGLLAEDMRFSEDIDWFWRAGEMGVPVRRVSEVVLMYYRHAASMTAGKDWSHQQRLAVVIQRSLQRRRARGLTGSVRMFGPEGEGPK